MRSARRTGYLAALPTALLLVTAACGAMHEPAPAAPPVLELPVTSVPAPSASEPISAVPPAPDPGSQSTAEPPEAGVGTNAAAPEPPPEEPIPCKTVDDCWSEGSKAIARPKNLRGRKFRPCKDGEHAPECDQGRCWTHGYRC